MKLIIGFFILLCAFFVEISGSYAQQAKETPATHMWIRTAVNSVVYVPVRSLEQCMILTQQAAAINSAEANCYNAEQLIKRINCQKSTKKDGLATCS